MTSSKQSSLRNGSSTRSLTPEPASTQNDVRTGSIYLQFSGNPEGLTPTLDFASRVAACFKPTFNVIETSTHGSKTASEKLVSLPPSSSSSSSSLALSSSTPHSLSISSSSSTLHSSSSTLSSNTSSSTSTLSSGSQLLQQTFSNNDSSSSTLPKSTPSHSSHGTVGGTNDFVSGHVDSVANLPCPSISVAIFLRQYDADPSERLKPNATPRDRRAPSLLKILKSSPWQLHHVEKIPVSQSKVNVKTSTSRKLPEYYYVSQHLPAWSLRHVHHGQEHVRVTVSTSHNVWDDQVKFYSLVLGQECDILREDFCLFTVRRDAGLDYDIQLALKRMPESSTVTALDHVSIKIKVMDLGKLVALLPNVCQPISDVLWETRDHEGNKIVLGVVRQRQYRKPSVTLDDTAYEIMTSPSRTIMSRIEANSKCTQTCTSPHREVVSLNSSRGNSFNVSKSKECTGLQKENVINSKSCDKVGKYIQMNCRESLGTSEPPCCCATCPNTTNMSPLSSETTLTRQTNGSSGCLCLSCRQGCGRDLDQEDTYLCTSLDCKKCGTLLTKRTARKLNHLSDSNSSSDLKNCDIKIVSSKCSKSSDCNIYENCFDDEHDVYVNCFEDAVTSFHDGQCEYPNKSKNSSISNTRSGRGLKDSDKNENNHQASSVISCQNKERELYKNCKNSENFARSPTNSSIQTVCNNTEKYKDDHRKSQETSAPEYATLSSGLDVHEHKDRSQFIPFSNTDDVIVPEMTEKVLQEDQESLTLTNLSEESGIIVFHDDDGLWEEREGGYMGQGSNHNHKNVVIRSCIRKVKDSTSSPFTSNGPKSSSDFRRKEKRVRFSDEIHSFDLTDDSQSRLSSGFESDEQSDGEMDRGCRQVRHRRHSSTASSTPTTAHYHNSPHNYQNHQSQHHHNRHQETPPFRHPDSHALQHSDHNHISDHRTQIHKHKSSPECVQTASPPNNNHRSNIHSSNVHDRVLSTSQSMHVSDLTTNASNMKNNAGLPFNSTPSSDASSRPMRPPSYEAALATKRKKHLESVAKRRPVSADFTPTLQNEVHTHPLTLIDCSDPVQINPVTRQSDQNRKASCVRHNSFNNALNLDDSVKPRDNRYPFQTKTYHAKPVKLAYYVESVEISNNKENDTITPSSTSATKSGNYVINKNTALNKSEIPHSPLRDAVSEHPNEKSVNIKMIANGRDIDRTRHLDHYAKTCNNTTHYEGESSLCRSNNKYEQELSRSNSCRESDVSISEPASASSDVTTNFTLRFDTCPRSGGEPRVEQTGFYV